jgi:serpin B
LNAYDESAVPPTCPDGNSPIGKRCEAKPFDTIGGSTCLRSMHREGDLCVGDAKSAPTAKVLSANALMLMPDARGDRVSKDYAAVAKDKYAAEIFLNAGLDDVNNWVKAKTEGKIEKILDQLDPSAAAVILNAIYFKARWASIFDKNSTRNAVFHLTATHEVQVPTMHQTTNFHVVDRPGYRAIRLPYEVAELAMIIVLPDAIDGVDAVVSRLDTKELSDLFTELSSLGSPFPVDLDLPRFKANFSTELNTALQQAGMIQAFIDAADFSGITGRPPQDRGLKIGAIVHRAVIEAMEESTEAAAATAVVLLPSTAARPRPTIENATAIIPQ